MAEGSMALQDGVYRSAINERGDAGERRDEIRSDLQVIDLEEGHVSDKNQSQPLLGDFTKLKLVHQGTVPLEVRQHNEQKAEILTQCYKYPQKSGELLTQLNDFRLARKLVDVTLVSSDGRDFPCHRAVLAASSPYFGAMFTDDLLESHSDRIELSNVRAKTLEVILHAVYVCEAVITQDNVQDLLATAHFLSYHHIVESCCKFLADSLQPHNCLGIAQLAETYCCHELQDQAWKYALKNFKAVSSGQEFLSLKACVLEKLIGSDDLNVPTEDDVLTAVLNWVKSDEAHIAPFPSILAKVRLPLVNDDYLASILSSHQVVHSCGRNLSLVRDAQNLKELARKGRRRDHPLLRPRFAMKIEVLVIVGGMIDNREWVPYVSCFNPETGMWSSMADLPFDHSDYSAASVDDAIYVSGGFHRDRGTLSEVWRYSELNDEWIKVQHLTLPRYNHSSVGYNNHIYVLGGEDSETTLTDIEEYSPEHDKWTIIGSMNPTGSGMAAVALNGKLYTIGWLTNVRLMCVVQCFDLSTLECTVIPGSGLNRQLFPAVALNDSIFILGGNRMKEVAIYDPETFTSRKAESMKFKRNTPSATVVGGKIYVTGGELRQHVTKVESYNPELDLWNIGTPMPHAVCFHGCVMIRKYLGPPYCM